MKKVFVDFQMPEIIALERFDGRLAQGEIVLAHDDKIERKARVAKVFVADKDSEDGEMYRLEVVA